MACVPAKVSIIGTFGDWSRCAELKANIIITVMHECQGIESSNTANQKINDILPKM